MVNFGVQWLLPHFWASWVHGDGNGAIADGNTTVYHWQTASAAEARSAALAMDFLLPKPKESLLSHLNSWPGSHWKSRKNYRAYPGAPENALGRDQWHHRKWPRRSSRRPRDIWETPRFKNTGNPFQQRPRAIKKPSKAHCGLVLVAYSDLYDA